MNIIRRIGNIIRRIGMAIGAAFLAWGMCSGDVDSPLAAGFGAAILVLFLPKFSSSKASSEKNTEQ